MASRIDLNDLDKNATFELSLKPVEHPAERAARLRHEERTKMIELCKDLAIFGLIVLFFTLLTGASLWLVVFERDALAPEYRKFFESVLTVLMSGSVSFFLGKHVGRSGKG